MSIRYYVVIPYFQNVHILYYQLVTLFHKLFIYFFKNTSTRIIQKEGGSALCHIKIILLLFKVLLNNTLVFGKQTNICEIRWFVESTCSSLFIYINCRGFGKTETLIFFEVENLTIETEFPNKVATTTNYLSENYSHHFCIHYHRIIFFLHLILY